MTEFMIIPPEDCEFQQCTKCQMPYLERAHSPKGMCLWCQCDGDQLLAECKKEWDKADIDVRFE